MSDRPLQGVLPEVFPIPSKADHFSDKFRSSPSQTQTRFEKASQKQEYIVARAGKVPSMSLNQPSLERTQTLASKIKHGVTVAKIKASRFRRFLELAAQDILPEAMAQLATSAHRLPPDESDLFDDETSWPDSLGLVEAEIQSVSPTETMSSSPIDSVFHLSPMPQSPTYTSSMSEDSLTIQNSMEGLDRQFEPTCPSALNERRSHHAGCVAKLVRVIDHNYANEHVEFESRKQILSRTIIEMRACRKSRRRYELPIHVSRSHGDLVRSAPSGRKPFGSLQDVESPTSDDSHRIDTRRLSL